MTPLQIEIMLHYHTRTTDYGGADDNFTSESVQGALIGFRLDGMLADNRCHGDTTYEITDKGRAYVAGLTKVNMPECHWHIPVDG